MVLVNAELDFMGGAIESGVGISSTPSLQQSSDLEKTQAELRQTFTAAEEFRRELEFLQKGGDPLDLKAGNVASVSFQSTSLTNRHPEQFVTSEAKGSFPITASPHGDSVESSDRLGAPSICEPNSADNLMLFDGDNNNKFNKIEKKSSHLHANNIDHITKELNDSTVLELPKKSYKRRVRSRPNREVARSSSNDANLSRAAHFLPFRNSSRELNSDSTPTPRSPNLKNSVKENELDGVPAVQSGVVDGNDLKDIEENHQGEDRIIKSDIREDPITVEKLNLTDSKHSPNGKTEISEKMEFSGPINGFDDNNKNNDNGGGVISVVDPESTCNESSQRFEGYNGNNGDCSAPIEQNLASKEVVEVEIDDLNAKKDDNKILNIEKDNSDICHLNRKDDGVPIKEEEEALKISEVSLQNELKNSDAAEQNECSQDDLKLAVKEREDSILEEARIIEAKRKRIAELSLRSLPMEKRLKSQWDYVLEEMSWLANDFAQERLWKVAAAAQISRRVAVTSRVRFQQQSSLLKQKEVAHTVAEAVMQFWHTIQVKSEEPESHCVKRDDAVGIHRYAMNFLEYNSSKMQYTAPAAHDSVSDLGVMDHSWEDNLTEENLFYTVPPGAIEAYRKAIESHLLQFERTGSIIQEEVDTSGYDAIADNAFEEDEGDTNTYYSQFESNKSTQKRRKNFKFYSGRSSLYETESNERNLNSTIQPSILSGKRPATSLNVSIPTKRVRTASRQRIISPFNNNNNAAGPSQVAPHRTDAASSGDNNSFQDEQTSLLLLHGNGNQMMNNNNNMEAESVEEYEKQLQFDSVEATMRPKKKKKAKHPGSSFDNRWQLDSNFQNDQKDHIRRRPEPHQFDSNGGSVASQMSNMSNPNKIMKLLVRDRGKKAKALKIPVGQAGSGSPWSLFEDQALVVLVHDMGPNWELISDAINSTLQFKCIFRKSRECKERHKILMDRNNGDGADSAEDSGSSQPYPSTLPGIPEGSARQLFQRLQGPMEEDTLKSHFEKIIMIGQKQHYRRSQKDNQDPKQLQQPHSSHAFALSQVCPNNLNGGHVLTPLELCESISATPEVVPVGYQGPHSGGLPPLNHGSVAPMLPGSGSGSGSASSAPGSSNSVHGSNLPAASTPLNPSVRERRYGIPRTNSLSVEDQQRMQQYNQLLSARNAQQSTLPPGAHSVADRGGGVRMLASGNNGMGVMCGNNRNMKIPRPGFATSASMLTPGTPSPSSASMHSPGVGPTQGNSMLRPRDPMHMIRPNQNTDHQAPQTVGTVPPFAGAPSATFPNQMLHHQAQPRAISPHHSQHPAYGMRFAKERQLQQQRLLQHQQFSNSNPMMPRVQPPPPLQESSSSSPQKHPAPPPQGIIPKQRFPQPNNNNQSKFTKGGRGNTSMLHQNGFSSQANLQKAYSGQIQSQSQQQKASHSSDNNINNNQNQNHQKLLNQKQAMNSQKALNNRNADSAPSNSGDSVRVSTPQTSGAGGDEVAVNRELLSENLPAGGHDGGVQRPS